MSKPIIPMPDTEKGRAYHKAMELLEEACKITEKYGQVTAQVLVMTLVGRALQQGIPKKQVLEMVSDTYDWAKGLQGKSAEEALKIIFGSGM